MRSVSSPVTTILTLVSKEFVGVQEIETGHAKKEFLQNKCCDVPKLKDYYLRRAVVL